MKDLTVFFLYLATYNIDQLFCINLVLQGTIHTLLFPNRLILHTRTNVHFPAKQCHFPRTWMCTMNIFWNMSGSQSLWWIDSFKESYTIVSSEQREVAMAWRVNTYTLRPLHNFSWSSLLTTKLG